MRSETAPFWSSFLVYTAIMMIVVAVIWMVVGKIKIRKDQYVVREENPQTFWMIIGGCFAYGLIALILGVPHFGPGG